MRRALLVMSVALAGLATAARAIPSALAVVVGADFLIDGGVTAVSAVGA